MSAYQRVAACSNVAACSYPFVHARPPPHAHARRAGVHAATRLHLVASPWPIGAGASPLAERAPAVTREREHRPAWRGRGPWRGWRCCSHCGHLLHFWAFRLRCPRHDCKLGGDPQ